MKVKARRFALPSIGTSWQRENYSTNSDAEGGILWWSDLMFGCIILKYYHILYYQHSIEFINTPSSRERRFPLTGRLLHDTAWSQCCLRFCHSLWSVRSRIWEVQTSSCLYSPLAGLPDTNNLTFLDKSWQRWQSLNELTIQDVQLSELTNHHLLSPCQDF